MKTAFAQVRLAVLGAVVLAGAGVAAALYGFEKHGATAVGYMQVKAQAGDTQQRLGSVYGERLEIDAFLARYNTLQSIGALGDESRLLWIERLAAIRNDMRLPRLTYNVAARAPSVGLTEPAPGLRLESSSMKLEFGLVHEGDLLQIIARLRAPPMGVFEIRNCALQRVPAAPAGAPAGVDASGATPGNLRGECLLDWTTLTGARPPVVPDAPPVVAKPS